ncbi:hypothetical protein GEMRC1_005865 [Eukaryota sp. GEM-RC1]
MFQVDGEIEELDSNVQKLNLDDGLSALDYCYPGLERERGGRADAMKVRWGLMACDEDENDDVSSQETRTLYKCTPKRVH